MQVIIFGKMYKKIIMFYHVEKVMQYWNSVVKKSETSLGFCG